MRASLGQWCSKVLAGHQGMDFSQLELLDADQIDLGDEGVKKNRGPTGVGAELKAYWLMTVEEEVAERMRVVRRLGVCGVS